MHIIFIVHECVCVSVYMCCSSNTMTQYEAEICSTIILLHVWKLEKETEIYDAIHVEQYALFDILVLLLLLLSFVTVPLRYCIISGILIPVHLWFSEECFSCGYSLLLDASWFCPLAKTVFSLPIIIIVQNTYN